MSGERFLENYMSLTIDESGYKTTFPTPGAAGLDQRSFQGFVRQYLLSALSYETDENDSPWVELDWTPEDFEKASLEAAMADCAQFVNENADDLIAAFALYDTSSGLGAVKQAARDFWFSRNGHGRGFFDRDLGDAGDRLQKAAEDWFGCDPYIGDDGKLYLSGTGKRGPLPIEDDADTPLELPESINSANLQLFFQLMKDGKQAALDCKVKGGKVVCQASHNLTTGAWGEGTPGQPYGSDWIRIAQCANSQLIMP